MCGIFGYANYNTKKTRGQVVETLVEGLSKLEYRGYDSTGIGIDSEHEFDDKSPVKAIQLIRQVGKVASLRDEIAAQNLDISEVLENHVGIAHTRWATHGGVTQSNCHPQPSDSKNEFIVVHNGIITNYRELKTFLKTKGYTFNSDTDTEIIAKLFKYYYEKDTDLEFYQLAKEVLYQLQGFSIIDWC
ncbi:unnamed protein product [Ambrosiozyma monospora]|uniref:Unnamed protein product n=1 Tax=Ambrosiozyma monospora TaxID=43982 RepID=A0ACB5TZI9_AMBMO|nr:unnamed protein product [Ambrosiozyma monospora]